MKVRADFVTNSSSSSFIINKDHVYRDKLLEILLEIANREGYWVDEPYTWKEDVTEDTVAYRYHIREATPEHPYNEDYYHRDKRVYDNHFVIHNGDCGRYRFCVIEEVLSEHNIPWEYGYCD